MASSFSAVTMVYLPGLPWTPMSSMPLRAPPRFLTIMPIARPMVAFAMSPGLSAPWPPLMRSCSRIGPFTIQNGAQEPVLTSNVPNAAFGSRSASTPAINSGR